MYTNLSLFPYTAFTYYVEHYAMFIHKLQFCLCQKFISYHIHILKQNVMHNPPFLINWVRDADVGGKVSDCASKTQQFLGQHSYTTNWLF